MGNLLDKLMGFISNTRNCIKIAAFVVLLFILWANYNCVSLLIGGNYSVRSWVYCLLYALFLMLIPAMFGASTSFLLNQTEPKSHGLFFICSLGLLCWFLLVAFVARAALGEVAKNGGYTAHLFSEYKTYNHDLLQAIIPMATSLFALLTSWFAFDKKIVKEEPIEMEETEDNKKIDDEGGEE